MFYNKAHDKSFHSNSLNFRPLFNNTFKDAKNDNGSKIKIYTSLDNYSTKTSQKEELNIEFGKLKRQKATIFPNETKIKEKGNFNDYSLGANNTKKKTLIKASTFKFLEPINRSNASENSFQNFNFQTMIQTRKSEIIPLKKPTRNINLKIKTTNYESDINQIILESSKKIAPTVIDFIYVNNNIKYEIDIKRKI